MRPLALDMPREELWERWLLGAAIAAFALLAFLEVWNWRPGFARTDETIFVGYLQERLEGAPAELELFLGTLYQNLAAWAAMLCGPSLIPIHAVTWIAILLESWLLFRLASALLSRRAACWSVLALLAGANFFLRARSLLVFAVMPAQLLVMVCMLERDWGRWGSLTYGATAALLMADYEAWTITGLPVLAFLWVRADRASRPRLGWCLAGFSAAAAALFAHSWQLVLQLLVLRSQSLPGHAMVINHVVSEALRSFFIGTPVTTPHLGVRCHSIFPTWALLLLPLGCWSLGRRGVPLYVWILLGLAPILSGGGSGEPNRLITAWPALCLIAGQGAATLFSRFPGRRGTVMALAMFLSGAIWEASAYAGNMAAAGGAEYGPSEAVQRLAKKYSGRKWVADFDWRGGSSSRFLRGGGSVGRDLFVLRWEYLPALGGLADGVIEEPVSAASTPLLVLQDPPLALANRLRRADSAIRELRMTLPRRDRRLRSTKILEILKLGQIEPLAGTVLLEQALLDCSDLGRLEPGLIVQVMRYPLVCASAPLWLSDLARASGDEASVRLLCKRAKAIDPRCDCRQ